MDIDPQKIIASPFVPGILGAWAALYRLGLTQDQAAALLKD